MFKKILVPLDIDYADTAVVVYQKAAAIATLSGAEIKLISVMPGFGMPIVAAYFSDEVRKETADKFTAAVDDFVKTHCDEAVSYTISIGKNWEEIIKVADNWSADLIVVYHNRHREINEVFSQSCSQRVSDHAKCSVLRLRNIRT
jgi:nucleotide-binding universal stress UspA family protein